MPLREANETLGRRRRHSTVTVRVFISTFDTRQRWSLSHRQKVAGSWFQQRHCVIIAIISINSGARCALCRDCFCNRRCSLGWNCSLFIHRGLCRQLSWSIADLRAEFSSRDDLSFHSTARPAVLSWRVGLVDTSDDACSLGTDRDACFCNLLALWDAGIWDGTEPQTTEASWHPAHPCRHSASFSSKATSSPAEPQLIELPPCRASVHCSVSVAALRQRAGRTSRAA